MQIHSYEGWIKFLLHEPSIILRHAPCSCQLHDLHYSSNSMPFPSICRNSAFPSAYFQLVFTQSATGYWFYECCLWLKKKYICIYIYIMFPLGEVHYQGHSVWLAKYAGEWYFDMRIVPYAAFPRGRYDCSIHRVIQYIQVRLHLYLCAEKTRSIQVHRIATCLLFFFMASGSSSFMNQLA